MVRIVCCPILILKLGRGNVCSSLGPMVQKIYLSQISIRRTVSFYGTGSPFGVLMPNEAILAKVGYVPQLQTMKQVTLPITVEEFIVFGLYRSFGYLKVPRKKDQSVSHKRWKNLA